MTGTVGGEPGGRVPAIAGGLVGKTAVGGLLGI